MSSSVSHPVAYFVILEKVTNATICRHFLCAAVKYLMQIALFRRSFVYSLNGFMSKNKIAEEIEIYQLLNS